MKKDKSPKVHQNEKIKETLTINSRVTFTDKQKELTEILQNKHTKLVFLSGPAGSSKTFISVYSALNLLNEKKVSELIYVRSAVESADSKLGFLPGEMDEKMSPYIQPLVDKLDELLPKGQVDRLKKEERILGMPVNFLRGLNWNAKCIIADEAQNMTKKELITLITRVGEFSKLFICGDPDQSDINGKSGFSPIMTSFDDEESRNHGIFVFKFTEEDIVRSELVKFILKKLKNNN